MNNLKITVMQASAVWEDAAASRSHLDTLLKQINTPTDVVVLPEMFTTGFSMKPESVAEHFDEQKMETLNWMRQWAGELNAVVTGSVSVEEDGRYYNRLLWVRPDGSYSKYDKRHTFTFAGEHEHYQSGSSLLIEEWRGWKICPLICYDLRFPVWSRNRLVKNEPLYDVLIYVASWPEVRREPWKKLLLARAIENQSYVVAVNRVGTDGNNLPYTGDSSFINPRGEYLHELTPSQEEVVTIELSHDELVDFRKKFPVLNDADGFMLK
jgi:omega-amidase